MTTNTLKMPSIPGLETINITGAIEHQELSNVGEAAINVGRSIFTNMLPALTTAPTQEGMLRAYSMLRDSTITTNETIERDSMAHAVNVANPPESIINPLPADLGQANLPAWDCAVRILTTHPLVTALATSVCTGRLRYGSAAPEPADGLPVLMQTPRANAILSQTLANKVQLQGDFVGLPITTGTDPSTGRNDALADISLMIAAAMWAFPKTEATDAHDILQSNIQNMMTDTNRRPSLDVGGSDIQAINGTNGHPVLAVRTSTALWLEQATQAA